MAPITKKEAASELDKRQKRFSEKDLANVVSKEEVLEEKFTKQDRLKVHFSDFKMLFSMLRDYTTRRYTAVPWYIISSIGAALLYVISPLDLLPDFIPIIGYIDDATVLALCLNLVHKEILLYKAWKEETHSDTAPAS
ncbi:MAG: YkvA family protein [Flavobacteriaceae bacterium]